MKRNINLLVLGFEIAVIVILHAVKINHTEASARSQENNASLTSNMTVARPINTLALTGVK